MKTLHESLEKYSIKIYAFCAMPNHWHLLASCSSGAEMIRGLQRLGATHAIRLRLRYESIGRGAVYQSRYRSYAVKANQIFWIVARYIERNPVRAKLCRFPENWNWSSAGQKIGHPIPLDPWPIPKPIEWRKYLRSGGSLDEEKEIREALIRGSLGRR